jgi:hypothetical protein
MQDDLLTRPQDRTTSIEPAAHKFYREALENAGLESLLLSKEEDCVFRATD